MLYFHNLLFITLRTEIGLVSPRCNRYVFFFLLCDKVTSFESGQESNWVSTSDRILPLEYSFYVSNELIILHFDTPKLKSIVTVSVVSRKDLEY